MIMNRAFLLLAAMAALGPGSASAATDAECLAVGASETICEAISGCYWANWGELAGECRAIPSRDAQCECTLPGGCGGVLDTSWSGPSGCEPVRFCYYSVNKCRAQLDLSSDGSCYEDGDKTGKCAPAEYCEPSSAAPTNLLLFFDSHCVLKAGVTKYPTASPIVRPPNAIAAPSPDVDTTEEPAPSETFSVVPVLAGVGAAVALGMMAGFVYFRRWSVKQDHVVISEALQMRSARAKDSPTLPPVVPMDLDDEIPEF